MKNLEFRMMVVAVDLSPVDGAVGVIKARKLGEINTDSKEEALNLFEEFKKQAGENEIVQLYDTQKIAECGSSHKLSGFAANDSVAYTDDIDSEYEDGYTEVYDDSLGIIETTNTYVFPHDAERYFWDRVADDLDKMSWRHPELDIYYDEDGVETEYDESDERLYHWYTYSHSEADVDRKLIGIEDAYNFYLARDDFEEIMEEIAKDDEKIRYANIDDLYDEHDFNILVIGCRDNEWHMDGSSIYDVLEEIHTNDYEKMSKRVDYIIENQCQLYSNHTLHFIEEESGEMARFDDETQSLFTDDYEIWDSENEEIITNR